jgi:nucleotide-binding universal stress UspA family protein
MKTTSKLASRSVRSASAVRGKASAAKTVRSNNRLKDVSQFRIRSILVPIDFSAPSIQALMYAARFADKFGAKLLLLNVVEPSGTPDFMASFPLVIESEDISRLAEEHLRNLPAKHAVDPKLIERTLVRTGAAFHEITSAARTLKADLIIIATNGHTGFKHFMLGSTAERVVRYAPCPVFVIRDQDQAVEAIC